MPEYDCALASLIELMQSWSPFTRDLALPASEEEIAAAERELGVVFPRSYRAFLRHFGAGTVHSFEIYGIPSDRLWGDVVMMNQLSSRPLARHYVKFTEEVGQRCYYLDTARMNAERECPVVAVGPGKKFGSVADSFLDFLWKASEGLI